MKEQCRINILPGGHSLSAVEGDNLYTLLLVNGLVAADDPTAERFRLERGVISPAASEEAEAAVFSRAELSEGWMLASQRQVIGDADISLVSEPDPVGRNLASPLGSGYGMAFDLGGGTVAAGLVNLDNHLIPLMTACPSSHFSLVVDETERRRAAADDPQLCRRLIELLRGDMDSLTEKLVRRAGIKAESITTVTVAGSYFMICLLCGQLPPARGEQQGFACGRTLVRTAGELGLHALRPQVRLYLLPAVNAELGGDMTAAALAAGLPLHRDDERLTLLVDLAMQGQIMLAGRGRILACSIPSLPFEGVGIRWGMPAVTGAINAVQIDELVTLKTVRDGRPQGLCGAGLISALFCLLQHGLLDADGHLCTNGSSAPAVAQRFRVTPGGREFVLSAADRRFPDDIVISQDDILQMQLAKGTLYAAGQAMLRELSATEQDIDSIMLAESYRANLVPREVLGLGLLPRVAEERISSIGNAAWQGAYLALMARRNVQELEQLAGSIESVDLTVNSTYANEFMQAMDFRL